jgi:N-acetylmuramoyl-L-alanine amidase
MMLVRAAAAVIAVMLPTGLLFGAPTIARGEPAATSSIHPAATPGHPRCDPAKFRIVVDVGHTAKVPGAKSARGAHEYDFNLRLAKIAEHDLIAGGFPRTVLMITAEPPYRGLIKRVLRARKLGADLLLSIHHDSVPNSMLETWTFEGEEHHFSDRFRGHSIFISNFNARRSDSLAFARLLGLQMKARGLHYTPHYTLPIMGHRRRQLVDAEAGVYRYDQLVVLKDSRIPAVLLEAGSIINRDEELLMATPEHQALISAAIVDAAKAYCAETVPRAPAVVRRPARRSRAGSAIHRPWWPFGRK